MRELYPANTFHSQSPPRVHFGLGDAGKVDRLVIRWPSGLVQELSDLPADRHILVAEGDKGAAAVRTVVPGRVLPP